MKNIFIKAPHLREGVQEHAKAGVCLSTFTFIAGLVILLACFSYNAGAQVINAEAKLQNYTIKIGDQTKLFLSVYQPVKAKIVFPKLVDTIVGKVQIVSVGKPDTVINKSDQTSATVTQSYVITCFDAGTYTIHPFSFNTPGGVLTTNELTLQVQTVKVDTTKAIYDIKQPMAVSYTLWDWLKDHWLWVLIDLVIIAAIVWLIWYLKNKPKAEPVVKEIIPVIPLHITILNQLQQLRDKKLWQNNQVKQYHIELSDVLREYLEKRYAIKTHEKTTDEIFDGLRYVDINEENRNSLRKILVLADLVKFAKENPVPAENEQSMDSAINFVNKTAQAPQQSPPIEKGGVDEPV